MNEVWVVEYDNTYWNGGLPEYGGSMNDDIEFYFTSNLKKAMRFHSQQEAKKMMETTSRSLSWGPAGICPFPWREEGDKEVHPKIRKISTT